MKTFQNCAAQGDLLLRRIDKLPAGLVQAKAQNGEYILAFSETHHHHSVAERPNVRMYDSEDPFVSYLEVIEATDATECLLEHLRSYDTHETIRVPPGIFEVRRQREHTPEGWRRAQD
jgi:hypothetical protein